ncbi:pectate lyase-like protein [Spirosoma oryzae]|uniref:Pectate lyase-like protein n=1 Tax=Spirosoma oryzae TaxID=1469603 RepID=A0A2T0RQA6_9BACT|nr:glycosyl hydrolase family 28-related protein [Spirosoma oryzae]PRY23273.1 pectate lyase-like protein [Spirosoma oryzae]
MINVKDAQFGAQGNGSADDTAAIQSAVNYAQTIVTPGTGGSAYRPTVYFPAGYYRITSPINITNTSGVWLAGDGGRWLSTVIFGQTSGAIFDFSGSNNSGCENFEFLSVTNSGNIRSTIGVQFALTSGGGLNNGIRNCTFNMEDYATTNGGFGTIGILNVRSEEFYIHECLIRANTPIIMSNNSSLASTGINFTATSNYQAIAAGLGSMGVTSILGTSIQTYEKRQPGLVLNGTNSLTFQGYISRASANSGSNETAILCSQYTTNLRIHATVESYSRMVRILNTGLQGARFDIVSANSLTPTTELFDFTGCNISGVDMNISVPNSGERNNRYVVYYTPDNGGAQQASGSLRNSTITCYGFGNPYVITANLLKKSTNVLFQTDTPFEKKSGRIRQLTNNVIQAGNLGSVTTTTVFQFRQSNQLTSTSNSGGYYRIWLDGVIRTGGYGSGANCTLSFQAQITVNQSNSGALDIPSVTVITLDKDATNPSYADIVGVVVNLNFSNGIGSVTVTPRITGSGSGEPVYYDGFAEIQSDFFVNDPIPLN